MECANHTLKASSEPGIYVCMECGGDFQVQRAYPRCQMCGERQGHSKVHVDMGFFQGVVHEKCLDDFRETCEEIGYGDDERRTFFERKRQRWQTTKTEQLSLI